MTEIQNQTPLKLVATKSQPWKQLVEVKARNKGSNAPQVDSGSGVGRLAPELDLQG